MGEKFVEHIIPNYVRLERSDASQSIFYVRGRLCSGWRSGHVNRIQQHFTTVGNICLRCLFTSLSGKTYNSYNVQ